MGKYAVLDRAKFSAGVGVIAVSLISAAFGPMVAHATPPTAFVGPSSLSGMLNTPISVAGVQLTGDGSSTVSMKLRVHSGQLELTDDTGVTLESENPSDVLTFTGTLTQANTALTHVEYTGDELGDDTLEASTVGPDQVYYPGNGHLYEVVEYDMDPGDGIHGINWNTARTQAIARTYQGLSGYLVTITSAEENSYVGPRLGQAGWMGASDSVSEGDWKWVGGPESGQSFWSGAADGSSVSGRYNNWTSGSEPNDAEGEDCAQFLSGDVDAEWNDLSCDGQYLPAYVVEYGGPGSLPVVATKNVNISVTADTKTASTCAELAAIGEDSDNQYDTINLTADIDCHGATVAPIFGNNNFYGTFNGQGHTIKNFVINGVDTAYSEGNGGGLFMFTDGATIKNLNLRNGSVSGNYEVGGLIGSAYNTDIENVTSSITVDGGNQYAGGLVGNYNVNEPSHHISGSSATGNVAGDSYVGGLIGYMNVGNEGVMTLEKSFATGDVTATGDEVGGLIGEMTGESYGDSAASTVIQDVYAQGDVTVDVEAEGDDVGGLIGYLEIYEDGTPNSFTLRRAYASGSVSGYYDVGALIGYMQGPNDEDVSMSVTSTFAAGYVTGQDSGSTAAMVGWFNADEEMAWSDNYYDQNRTGQSDCSGADSDNVGTCIAKNTDGSQPGYFFDQAHDPMSDWDFDDIWVAHDATYPTFGTMSDDDEDGIDSSVEAAAPNDGDANNDGTSDDEQTNVSSFTNPVTSKYVSLEVSAGCENTDASVASEDSKAVKDSGYSYPGGLLSFTTQCGTPGYTATITQYYYGLTDTSMIARKYSPITHGYFTVPGATVTAVTIGGQHALKITYQVTDGGNLDLDGTANGTIVDPAGPAQSVVGSPNTGVRTLQSILFKQ